MANPFTRKSKEFLDLQTKWYDKLKKDGFNDAERSDNPSQTPALKAWHSFYFPLKYNATVFETRQQYYRLAAQYMHENEFESKLEHLIWSHHSEGASLRQISRVAKSKGYKLEKDAINKRLKLLVNRMFTFYRKQRLPNE